MDAASSSTLARKWPRTPTYLAQLRRPQVIEHETVEKDVGVAVKTVAHALDGGRVDSPADIEALASAQMVERRN